MRGGEKGACGVFSCISMDSCICRNTYHEKNTARGQDLSRVGCNDMYSAYTFCWMVCILAAIVSMMRDASSNLSSNISLFA